MDIYFTGMLTGLALDGVLLDQPDGDARATARADAVALARGILYDPRWPWHAAAELGARVRAPKQYWRSQPREYKDLFTDTAFGQR